MWISKLPLGETLAVGIDTLSRVAAPVLDVVTAQLERALDGTSAALLACPVPLFIAVVALLTQLLRRRWGLTLFVAGALALIANLGFWVATLQTLTLVLAATSCCMAVGVPLGVAAAHHPRFASVLEPVLDLMQTVPTFVYLIPALTLFGLGTVPGLAATVVFAVAAPIRMTALGLRGVPHELVEAGRAFGHGGWSLLWRVELPHARASLGAGLSQCLMLSLSMVVVAALVGGDGLGKPVIRALNTADVALGFDAGLCIVLLAIVLDRLLRRTEERTS